MTGSGVLALWKDCAPGYEEKFEHWYQTEHAFERLSVPGFLRCRRYHAVSATPEYLTWYEVESPGVLHSKAYRARLDNPTQATTEIMSNAMKNMNRTLCQRHIFSGDWFGTHAVTVRLAMKPVEAGKTLDRDTINRLYASIESRLDPVSLARSELWMNAETTTENSAETTLETAAEKTVTSVATKEETLRGGDVTMDACLLLEFLNSAQAKVAMAEIEKVLPSADIGHYQLLCERRLET